VPRALPDGLGARVDPARWTMPSVMRLVGALGGMEDDDVRATFNGGIGMIAVVAPAAVAAAIAAFAARDLEATLIGEVVETDRLDGQRYVESPLEAPR
jgi:phosphoribosylformylglycinamidine cyclo-ligase